MSRNPAIALAQDLLFLVGQAMARTEILAGLSMEARKTRYVFSFYMLGLTHAAHAASGLVPLVFIAVRALRGYYGRARCAGVLFMNMYGHFLAATWVALFEVLLAFATGGGPVSPYSSGWSGPTWRPGAAVGCRLSERGIFAIIHGRLDPFCLAGSAPDVPTRSRG